MSAVGAARGGIATTDEARRVSEEMEDAVDKLSEVDEAHVVAVGNMALVSVKFDGQYQGGVDDGAAVGSEMTVGDGVSVGAVQSLSDM